jgi:hypothetical protein
MNISLEQVNRSVSYHPDTGQFVWLVTRGKAKAGAIAGGPRPDGYWYISVCGRRFLAHRLAFLVMTGRAPERDIDHINGNRSDNRWGNLRDVTVQMNRQNQRQPKSASTSKLLGAFYDPRCGRWYSNIRANGRRVPLGRFDTAEQAHAAHMSAKRRLHVACTI